MFSQNKNIKKIFKKKNCWLITGVAGFIGSSILEILISNNQYVIGVDNFSSGKKKNIIKYLNNNEKNFILIKKNICNLKKSDLSNFKIDYLIHLAALASVDESIKNPKKCYKNNVFGFENLISCVSKLKSLKRIIYASSAAVYGNTSKKNSEHMELNPLSPYAKSKIQNEKTAKIYSKKSKIKFTGIRFFNIFGTNQDPKSQYSSVISKWISKLKNNKKIEIYGNGYTSRDFCHVNNVIFFILLSLNKKLIKNEIFNLGSGKSITLNYLAKFLIYNIKNEKKYSKFINYKSFKKGDIYKSNSNIYKIKKKIYPKVPFSTIIGLKNMIKNHNF